MTDSESTLPAPHRDDRAELAYQKEVLRKLLHLFALIIPIGYQVAPRNVAVAVCFAAFIITLAADVARLQGWPIQRFWIRWTSPIVRPKERDRFTGATNILASAWLCPLLFSIPAATMGMTAIILGDTAAALIGRRWGRHRIRTGRSVEGSLAFLAAASLGGIVVPKLALNLALAGALLATIVEAVTSRIDDNLSVPIVVALFTDVALRVV